MIRTKRLLLSFGTMMILFAAANLHARQETATRAELEAMLEERDALIGELQSTIRELLAQIRENESSSGEFPAVPAPGSDPSVESHARSDVTDDSPEPPDDPTRLAVDEVAAERALERTLVQSGALLLPKGRVEFVPTLLYQMTETGLPVSVDAGSGAVIEGETKRSVSALDLLARIGLPGDSQLEIGLPYSSIEQQSRVFAGGATLAEDTQVIRATGDLRLGVSKTLARERGWRPDIVGRLAYGFGNGDRVTDNVVLGGGFDYIDATLSFVKRRDPLALFFSLGYTDVKDDGGIDPGNISSVSLGAALAASPESSLFGAVTYRSASATRLDGIDVSGGDVDFTSVSLGMSTILGRGQLLNIAAEIGVSDAAPDYALSFSLPMQW